MKNEGSRERGDVIGETKRPLTNHADARMEQTTINGHLLGIQLIGPPSEKLRR